MHILVTRPLAEAERTAATLRAQAHRVLLAPMLAIEPLPHAAIGAGPWAAVIMTSGNAARALTSHPGRASLQPLPVFAVGRQTAAAAQAAGFRNVVSADGDAADLLRLLSAQSVARDKPLLYLAGNDRARDLAGDLAAQGVGVQTVVIYNAVAASELPQDVRQSLERGDIDAVLHYSRRTAAIFADAAGHAGLHGAIARVHHYCLSARAAEPLVAAGAQHVHVAKSPDEEALLALLSPG